MKKTNFMSLNNTNFKNWLYKLPQRLEFILEYCFTIYLKCHIRLVHFFIKTKIGFLFYVFCVLYGFFGHDETIAPLSNFIAAVFALYILESSIELWILVKIPVSREFLEKLLTREYIIKYLGENIASEVVIRAATIIMSTTILEVGSKGMENVLNQSNGDRVHDTFIRDHELSGRPIDMRSKEYKAMIEEMNSHLRRPTAGVITKTINAESFRHAVSTAGSTMGQMAQSIWPWRSGN
jgi:hypothetical protein